MLFNSFTFLFLFLPVTLAVWQLLRYAVGLRIALGWLILASLFFLCSQVDTVLKSKSQGLF